MQQQRGICVFSILVEPRRNSVSTRIFCQLFGCPCMLNFQSIRLFSKSEIKVLRRCVFHLREGFLHLYAFFYSGMLIFIQNLYKVKNVYREQFTHCQKVKRKIVTYVYIILPLTNESPAELHIFVQGKTKRGGFCYFLVYHIFLICQDFRATFFKQL